MMYRGFPPWQARVVRLFMGLAWLCIVGAGLSAVINPSPTVTLLIPFWRPFIAIDLIIAGIVCAYGAFANRYRWEWAGSWPIAVGLIPYAVISWAIVTVTGYPAGAFLFTCLVFLTLGRGVYCGGVAARLRAEALVVKHIERHLDSDGGDK